MALETAIILPILLILLVGMLEFGRVYNVQISLTHSAREGARHAAIHSGRPTLDTTRTALDASPSLAGLPVTVVPTGTCANPGESVRVETRVRLRSMTGLLEAQFFDLPPLFPLNLRGIGVMRCGG
ncbi:pilus assembly protein [Arthrobacter sp. MSA 4-2]|nr:pilus assembly protein [Arthrobacter sp. MSA 4-2]